MQKETNCVVCGQSSIKGFSKEARKFSCFDCFRKKYKSDRDGGGLRVFSRVEIL